MQVKERVERKLEKSGRITPREVLEAYEETGLKPARLVYVEGDEACAIGALMWRDGVWPTRVYNGSTLAAVSSALDSWTASRMDCVGRYYRTGFETAFDGGACPIGTTAWERKGWRDGRRVRRFVFSS